MLALLFENWQAVVGLVGLLFGGGGLLAYLRFRRIEVPQAETAQRKEEQDAYKKLLENMAEQGTQIARLSGELDEERKKRRALEDRVDDLESKLAVRDRTIEIYQKGVIRLHKQIRKLGAEPIWSFEG